jgi:hypothetical protein
MTNNNHSEAANSQLASFDQHDSAAQETTVHQIGDNGSAGAKPPKTLPLNPLSSSTSESEGEGDRETFYLPSGSYPIAKAAKRIFQALALRLTIFIYCGMVVELCLKRRGELELSAVTPSAFRSRVEVLGELLRHAVDNKGKSIRRPSRCSEDAAKALLATIEAQIYLPPIASVLNAPVIRAAGNRQCKVMERGYYPEFGGILITKGDCPAVVPLSEAIDSILWLLRDFKCVTPSDRSRAVAMLLTPALVFGQLLGNHRAPMFLVAANKSMTGKGYLIRLITAIYGEDPKLIAQRKGGVGGFDEDFSARLFEGHPFIVLDNLRGSMDSTHIEAFMTAERSFLARTPHRAAADIDPRHFVVMATSNGFQTTPDLQNRTITINLLKRAQTYRFRPYSQGDLISHVRSQQAYFLGCVFAVISEWIAQGSLTSTDRRHNFVQWAQTLDWILMHCFQGNDLGRLLDEQPITAQTDLADRYGLSEPES